MKYLRLSFFSIIFVASTTSISFAVCGTTELDGVWGGAVVEYNDDFDFTLLSSYCVLIMTDGVINVGSRCILYMLW